MKYIKKYENSSLMDSSLMDTGPKRGDFVICNEGSSLDNWRLKKLQNFLATNIGRIVSDKLSSEQFTVYYPNYKDDLDLVNFFNNPSPGCRLMLEGEIEYFAETKEELEMIISANKYNL